MGEILGKNLAGTRAAPRDDTQHFVSWAIKATGDLAFERGGHRRRIRRIQDTPAGREALERLLERVEKHANRDYARRVGLAPIENPAAVLAKGLVELDPGDEGG